MHIVHIVESFSPLSETFIYDIIKGLSDLDDIKITVLTTNNIDTFRSFEPTLTITPNKNIEYYSNILKYRIQGDKEGYNYTRYRMFSDDIKKHLTRLKPDLIHCHFGTMSIASIDSAQKLNIPIIGSFYGYDVSTNLKHPVWIKNYTKQLNKLTAAIGISNHINTKVNRFVNEKKIHLIHLAIDASAASHTFPSQRIDDRITATFIGRFVEKKSPLELLESFRIAKSLEKSDKLHLKMIGDGPLFQESLDFIKLHQLENSISLLGALPHNETLKELKDSHFYVQHSVTAKSGDQEGQGVTLVEALSYGLPIITTNHNGFTDVIKDNYNGFLVEEHDTNAMGERMVSLSENINTWDLMGENGIEHVKKEFNFETELSKLVTLYNDCIK